MNDALCHASFQLFCTQKYMGWMVTLCINTDLNMVFSNKMSLCTHTYTYNDAVKKNKKANSMLGRHARELTMYLMKKISYTDWCLYVQDLYITKLQFLAVT